MVNMSAKFEKEICYGVVSIVFTGPCTDGLNHAHTRTEPQQRYYIPTATQIIRVHPLTMVDMSTKFDQEAQNGLVYRVHMLISIYIFCDLDL